jgi:hypothetical protein
MNRARELDFKDRVPAHVIYLFFASAAQRSLASAKGGERLGQTNTILRAKIQNFMSISKTTGYNEL